jgi:hypothetical protein
MNKSMSEQEIKELVWDVAVEFADRGPGWAQEGVVLREVRDRVIGKRAHALEGRVV